MAAVPPRRRVVERCRPLSQGRVLSFIVALLCGGLLAAFGENLPIITVLDLKTSGLSADEARTIVSLLSSAVFQTGKYTVIDTAQRDTLLKEIEFSSTDCTDESCQIEIGKMLSAQYIVVGSLTQVGSRLILAIKMLETETSKTVSTADGKYASLDSLVDDIESLAQTLAGTKGTAAVAEAPKATEQAQPEAPAATQPTAKPAAPEAAKPAAPARVAKPVPVKTIASVSGLAVGLAAAGVGGYLLYAAIQYLNGPVEAAYQEYAALPPTAPQTDFDNLYADYVTAFGSYRSKLVLGVAVAGGGVIALGVSAVFLFLPERKAQAKTAAVSLRPSAEGMMISVRVPL